MTTPSLPGFALVTALGAGGGPEVEPEGKKGAPVGAGATPPGIANLGSAA